MLFLSFGKDKTSMNIAPNWTELSRAIRADSSSETLRQQRMFSVAMRLRLAGKNSQINLASPRPNDKQSFSGNRQTILLKNFRKVYSIKIHRLISLYVR